jgi:FkbM family methyltransferase
MLRDSLYISYLRTPPHFLKNRLLRLLRRLLLLKRVRFVSPAGVRMELDPTDFVQIMILHGGAYEPQTLERVRRLLPEGGTFVDVGGHVGQYALEAARKVSERGRVVVVEPNPRTFLHLKRNIELNGFGNIIPFIGAVASGYGFISMQFPREENWGESRQAESDDRAAYRVASFSLERLLDDLGASKIDVVKIDVEGHELDVLEGLFAGDRFLPDNIIIEHLPGHFSKSLKVPPYLRSKGYALYDVAGRPVDLDNDPYAALQEDNLWARRSDLPPVP